MNDATEAKFCPVCEDERACQRETRRDEYNVRGETVVIDVPVFTCPDCGSSVVDEETCPDVAARAFEIFRERKGLLTPEQIRTIRDRYHLSQKALATLLGMSEATINRYEGGGLQDEAHDNMLRSCRKAEIVKDLLARRGHLLSEKQRRKVQVALANELQMPEETLDRLALIEFPSLQRGDIDQFSGFRRFDYSKYAAVFAWFCRRLKGVFSTKIYKLLFYADFLAYKTFAESLTGTTYAKLQYGPVPDQYRELETRLERDGIFEVEEIDFPNGASGSRYKPGPNATVASEKLNDDEREVLEFVATTFTHYGAAVVSDRSHQETAWKDTTDYQMISYHHARDLSLSLPEDK